MAFPASNKRLADQLGRVQQAALMADGVCESLYGRSLGGNITAYAITIDLLPKLRAAYTVFLEAETVNGIAAYAQEQLGSPELDVVQEFAATKAAIEGVIAWVAANLPKDDDGYLLIETMGPDGSLSPRTFTPAQTAGLRTVLQAVMDTIA